MRKCITNALFLAEYLKKATGKDFAIETGTEGKNAIVLQLGLQSENPEAYQLKVGSEGVTIAAPTRSRCILWYSDTAQINSGSSGCTNLIARSRDQRLSSFWISWGAP